MTQKVTCLKMIECQLVVVVIPIPTVLYDTIPLTNIATK